MPMLQLRQIEYEIGARKLLTGIDWNINASSRLALIGPNGAGKTTLLKIITGEIEPTSGKIIRPAKYEIGYLPQEEIILKDEPILEMVLAGRKDLVEIEKRLQEMQEVLARNAHKPNSDLIEQQASLENQFRIRGGYAIRQQAKKILAGLGFSEKDFEKNLNQISGGWRMRAYLAKLLLQKPDLLLLDEPTNHLDLPSLEWLENFLKNFSGSLIIVSHDRFFIDKIASEIVELQEGSILFYPGNFHEYEILKRQEMEKVIHEWKNAKKIKEQQQKFIDRFRYKASKASQVQSRLKMLQKIDIPELPQTKTGLSFKLKVDVPSYKHVAKCNDVFFRYHQKWILENISFSISRTDKIALVGKNGAGKTTLMKLLGHELNPVKGEVIIGQRVSIGYFAQHRTEELNANNSVYSEVLETASDSHRSEIRNILGLFRFNRDDIEKKIGVLSGGEKSRVSLAKILASPVNFLMMDEPTNHLDMLSREALERALQQYEGTLLLISHDRYFLDKIVNRVFDLDQGHLSEYEGNYSDYLRLKPSKIDAVAEAETNRELTEAQKIKVKKRSEAQARQAVSPRRNQLLMQIREVELTEWKRPLVILLPTKIHQRLSICR
jgi:ATP-binding cassette subfamily F protein 3